MATRKKHTPEQVVRKLATADREPPPRQVHDLNRWILVPHRHAEQPVVRVLADARHGPD